MVAECGCRCQCGRGIITHDHDQHHRTPVVRTPAPLAPDAVLEGLAMDGLVAVLRQLGDLAELAAEVFDGLQDQVTAASARGRRLAARAKQLAADLPPSSAERGHLFLSNTTGASASCRRARTHLKVSRSLSHGVVVAGADTPRPRLVVGHIKRCRGPPPLSVLDRFDAGGDGACLKRYTDPSFFRSHFACSAKLQQIRPPGSQTSADSCDEEPPKSARSTDTKSSQTEDASESPSSPGFLWMLRQLKHRQAAGSVFASQKLRQMQASIQKHEPSTERRTDSSAGPSQAVILQFTSDHSTNHCDGGTCGGELLERTSSFEAWLSPDADPDPDADARFFLTAARRDEHCETTRDQEPSDGALAPDSTSTVEARLNPAAAEQVLPCKKGAGNHKRSSSSSSSSRYRGSIEMIAARVSSLPRKLFSAKHQHYPLADSSRSATGRIGVGGSIGDCRKPGSGFIPFPGEEEEALVPVLVSSDQAVLELGTPETESARLQCTGGPSISYYHAEMQEDACILNHRRSSGSIGTAEICRDRTCNETPDYSKNNLLLLPRRTGVPELPENPPSEGTRVDAPGPLPPPVPPMQWLPEKVRTAGPRSAASSPRLGGTPRIKPPGVGHEDRSNAVHSRVVRAPQAAVTMTTRAISQRSHHSRQNSETRTEEALAAKENVSGGVLRRDEMRYSEGRIQASEGGVVKTTGEVPALITVLPDESRSEIDLQTQQAQAGTRFQQQGEGGHPSGSTAGGCSSGYGSSSAEKVSQEEHVVVSDSSSSSNLQKESVFLSAVQQLAKMPPPVAAVPVPPRPKVLDDAGSQNDRIMLRNGPSLIHPSRNILDCRSVLLEKIKDKQSAFSLKPASPFPGSPTNSNSRVVTILQIADDIRRQAHAADRNNNDVGWSDDGA